MCKGFCLGDDAPNVDEINKLGGTWFVAGPPNYYKNAVEMAYALPQLKPEYVVWTGLSVPSNDTIDLVLRMPNFKEHWWQIGNEESNGTPYNIDYQFAASTHVAAMKAIRARDPKARFVLTMGHQSERPKNTWNRPVWLDKCWPLLGEYQDWVEAFQFHWYPEMEILTEPTDTFGQQFAKDCMQPYVNWMRRNGVYDRELWCGEIGLSGVYEDNTAVCWIQNLRSLFPAKVSKFAWYALARSEQDLGDARGYSLLMRGPHETAQWTMAGYQFKRI